MAAADETPWPELMHPAGSPTTIDHLDGLVGSTSDRGGLGGVSALANAPGDLLDDPAGAAVDAGGDL